MKRVRRVKSRENRGKYVNNFSLGSLRTYCQPTARLVRIFFEKQFTRLPVKKRKVGNFNIFYFNLSLSPISSWRGIR